ncbi:MAG: ABC transporter permease [Nitrospirae bacterium GWD2_57_9]|nr:MAG: ABC transporter permease [Nitrospirae bacterium GWD2_57_9]OGW46346.1 MAG: ABC transporter permease [Nitrospirae bacterium GWC2_57_9]
MTLTKLVVKNITRRPGRFVFTLLGIVIGIASFVTFLSLGGNLKREIHRESAALGANLVVTPKGSCAYEQVSILTGEQLPTTITMDEVAKIRAVKGIFAVPFLTEKTAITNRPVAVAGILPGEMKKFKAWEITEGDYFSGENEPGVVLGSVASSQFSLKPGSFVTVRGERLPVKGVLKETGGRDDVTIFLPLSVAQRIYKAGGHVSFVAVRVSDVALIDDTIEKIKETVSLGVVSDKQMLKSVLSIVGTVNITLQLIAAVAILAAAFGIVNTMMTATYERKREIGILQAMGAKQQTIFGIFVLESGFYGFLGGLAGAVAGMLFSTLASPYINQNAFTTFLKGSGTGAVIDLRVMAGSVLFAVLVAVLAGLYPAWRAARLSPVEAISYE